MSAAKRAMSAITAIAPWFGAKRNMAHLIVERIGAHRVYWEPFCGSLAVLLAKAPCVMETANDLHGDLINLARVLADDDLARKLYGRVSSLLLHEGLFTAAALRYRERGRTPASDTPDLNRAIDYMLVSWFGRNGVSGTSSYNQGFCVRYTANGGHTAKRWRSAVESIPAWHERLRNVTILNRDAFDLIDRIDDQPGTVIYCDPPYLRKGAKYVHDFAAPDHQRLADALDRFRKARVLVSYYDEPELYELYPLDRWTHERIEVTKALVNQGQRDSGGPPAKAVEVLICNEKRGLFA